MDPISLLGGVLVAGVVQAVKKYMGTNTAGTLGAVAVLALLVGGAEVWLQHVGYWTTTLQVLVTAGATYAFFIKNIEDMVTLG